MLGKKKCRILKEIRQKIADENDIPYVTHECRFQGECRGTCPRCENELRYLEKQLAARAATGKRIAIAALCAGMTLSMAGCTVPSDKNTDSDRSSTEDILGMMEGPDDARSVPEEEPSAESSTARDDTGNVELMGDVVYAGESSTR